MRLDLSAFRAANGLAGRTPALDAAFIFCATYLPFVMVALVLAYALPFRAAAGAVSRLADAAHVLAAVSLAFVIEQVIGFLWFRLRPFAALEGVTKLADRLVTEKSFPSGHATFAFALAAAVALHDRTWGNVLLGLAALVAFGRVAAGVHYPSDVVAGAVVGLLAARIALPVKQAVLPYLGFLADLIRHRAA